MEHGGSPAGAVSNNCDFVAPSPKENDILMNPIQGLCLIQESPVPGGCRILRA